jgi:hypothetical protein
MNGLMEEGLLVHGLKTTCMVKEFIHGKMEEGMKESI